MCMKKVLTPGGDGESAVRSKGDKQRLQSDAE